MGKKNVINNFCIGVSSNESRCTSCHIGYGWKDENFDFANSLNIDCIICHDRTGTYKKFPTGAGYPVSEEKKFGNKSFLPPDYTKLLKMWEVRKEKTAVHVISWEEEVTM